MSTPLKREEPFAFGRGALPSTLTPSRPGCHGGPRIAASTGVEYVTKTYSPSYKPPSPRYLDQVPNPMPVSPTPLYTDLTRCSGSRSDPGISYDCAKTWRWRRVRKDMLSRTPRGGWSDERVDLLGKSYRLERKKGVAVLVGGVHHSVGVWAVYDWRDGETERAW
jgi:hypothetical protein